MQNFFRSCARRSRSGASGKGGRARGALWGSWGEGCARGDPQTASFPRWEPAQRGAGLHVARGHHPHSVRVLGDASWTQGLVQLWTPLPQRLHPRGPRPPTCWGRLSPPRGLQGQGRGASWVALNELIRDGHARARLGAVVAAFPALTVPGGPRTRTSRAPPGRFCGGVWGWAAAARGCLASVVGEQGSPSGPPELQAFGSIFLGDSRV